MTDREELRAWMRRDDVQEAVARYEAEENAFHGPVNMTGEDMEWEFQMVKGYDGWEEEEAEQLGMELPVIRDAGTVAILIPRLPRREGAR